MTQVERIRQHLDRFGSITALEAMNQYGIMRLAAMMADLKRDGYKFTADRNKVTNRYGEDVTICVYRRA